VAIFLRGRAPHHLNCFEEGQRLPCIFDAKKYFLHWLARGPLYPLFFWTQLVEITVCSSFGFRKQRWQFRSRIAR
jgi:hypothetical protein